MSEVITKTKLSAKAKTIIALISLGVIIFAGFAFYKYKPDYKKIVKNIIPNERVKKAANEIMNLNWQSGGDFLTKTLAADTTVYQITPYPFDDNIVYFATSQGLFQMNLNDKTGQKKADGDIRNIAFDHKTPDRIYITKDKQLFISENGGSSWTTAFTFSRTISKFLVDKTDSNRLYILPYEWMPPEKLPWPNNEKLGIYISEDKGKNWNFFTLELPDTNTKYKGLMLEQSPIDNSIFAYFGSQTFANNPNHFNHIIYQILKTNNSWQWKKHDYISGFLGISEFNSMAFDSINKELYLNGLQESFPSTKIVRGFTVNDKIIFSVDYVTQFPQTVSSIAINPKKPNQFFIGTKENGVHLFQKFLDKKTPKNIGLGNYSVEKLVFNKDFTKLYVYATKEGVREIWYADISLFLTGINFNNQLSAPIPSQIGDWKLIGTPETPKNSTLIYQSFINPHDDKNMFVHVMSMNLDVSSWKLYGTWDEGKTWKQLFTSVNTGNALVFDPQDPNKIFFANKNKIYQSQDKGKTWQTIQEFPTQGLINNLILDVFDNNTLYASLTMSDNENFGGVYKSKDGGINWQFYPFSQKGLIVWAFAQNPKSGYLYAGTEIFDHPDPYNPPLFVSVDKGLSWKNIANNIKRHVLSIQFFVNEDKNQVYAQEESPPYYNVKEEGKNGWLNSDWQKNLVVPSIGSFQILTNPYYAPSQNSPLQTFRVTADVSGSAVTLPGVSVSYNGINFSSIGLDGLQVDRIAANGNFTKLYAAVRNYGIYVKNTPKQ